MTELKKVRIRREKASFPALILAFLVFSGVFFLSTVGVKEEKAIGKTTSDAKYVSKELAIKDENLYLIAMEGAETLESARISSARYMQRGAAGYLLQKDGKWYSIGNMYLSKEEANRMTEYLLKSDVKASVIPLAQKGVTLRVTAEEETSEALVFCLNAFQTFEKSLMDYSYRLDSGALSEREARVLLSVLSYDLSEKKAEAKRVLSFDDENAVKDIFEMYVYLLESASALTKHEGGEMMLSARIKYALIDNAIMRVNFLKKMHA